MCRLNGLPIFTFCNKMDRPALPALELCDQIEKEFGLRTVPINWPIGSGDRFKGVYHRPLKQVRLPALSSGRPPPAACAAGALLRRLALTCAAVRICTAERCICSRR